MAVCRLDGISSECSCRELLSVLMWGGGSGNTPLSGNAIVEPFVITFLLLCIQRSISSFVHQEVHFFLVLCIQRSISSWFCASRGPFLLGFVHPGVHSIYLTNV